MFSFLLLGILFIAAAVPCGIIEDTLKNKIMIKIFGILFRIGSGCALVCIFISLGIAVRETFQDEFPSRVLSSCIH